MHSRRLVIAVIAVITVVLGALLGAVPADALSDTGTGGQFVADNARLVGKTALTADTWTTVQVTGQAGLPDDGTVGAVVVNATAVGMTGLGQLSGRPDADTSSTLMLTYDGGGLGTTSGSSTLAVGDDGTIQVKANTDTSIYLDVEGYYTATDDGVAPGGFVSVPGTRIVDTRKGLGATKATIAPGKSVTIQVGGAGGVPSDASGVVANFLVVNESSNSGYITPYTTGTTRPGTSLNYAKGPSVPTSGTAQVALSADGQVTVYNASGAAGTIDLVVDVQGYFTADGSGAVFTPATGTVYDTRTGSNTAVGANATRVISVAGTAGVPVMGSGLTAVAVQVTAIHAASSTGSATVWADGTDKPGTTAVNFTADSIRGNTIIVPVGANGKIDLYNTSQDKTDYQISLQGWYVDPQTPQISCDSPYGNGTWTTQTSADDILCTITFAPVAASGEPTITVDGDGVDPETTDDVVSSSFALSSSSSTTISEWDSADAGVHTITAMAPSGAEAAYTYGVGNWSADSLFAMGYAYGSDRINDLSVISATDEIPDGATYEFHVADMNGTPVVDSGKIFADDGDHSGEWTIPEGSLDTNTEYKWYVDVTAPSIPAIGNTPAQSLTTVRSDVSDIGLAAPDPSADTDIEEGSAVEDGDSASDSLLSIKAVRGCIYGIGADTPHESSGDVSVHGYWTDYTCTDVSKATVTSQLQRSIGGNWKAIGNRGKATVKAGGGRGRRATSRHACTSKKKYTYRGLSTLSIPHKIMTTTVKAGSMATLKCG